VELVNKVIFKK